MRALVRRPGNKEPSAAYERTAALLEWTERLVSRNGGAELVVVPRIFRFSRLFHLEQEHVMELAAVGTDFSLAEQRIVCRHLLHLCDDRFAIGIAFKGLDSLEIVQHGGVYPSLYHAGHIAFVLRCESLGEASRSIVAIPIKCFGQKQALGGGQTERMHVVDKDKEASGVLSGLNNAELGRLLDCVDGVAARVGEADDLGLRALRLKKKR
jgi:hypothetical protein